MESAVGGKLPACLVFLSLSSLCLTATDYCSLKCAEGTHTMCLYKQGSPGSKCTDYHNATLKEGEKVDIVHIHNKIRMDLARGNLTSKSGLQPAAANMMQLVWDPELAEVAQRWADQCKYEHDVCRRVERFYVGQNIAMRTAAKEFTSEDLYDSIEMWLGEVYLIEPDIINKHRESDSDHYTQLAWALTGAVGCGASIYKSNEAEYTALMVCNYGPSGNRPSEPVYIQGEPCSACPEDTSCSTDYEGLCFSPAYATVVRDVGRTTYAGSVPVAHDEGTAAVSVPVSHAVVLLVEVAMCWLLSTRVS